MLSRNLTSVLPERMNGVCGGVEVGVGVVSSILVEGERCGEGGEEGLLSERLLIEADSCFTSRWS